MNFFYWCDFHAACSGFMIPINVGEALRVALVRQSHNDKATHAVLKTSVPSCYKWAHIMLYPYRRKKRKQMGKLGPPMKPKLEGPKRRSVLSSNTDHEPNIPSCLLMSKSSQDVFLRTQPNGYVSLAKSSHVGHQFFKSLAELNRDNFLNALKRSPKDIMAGRIALTVLTTISGQDRGKIFQQKAGSTEWRLVEDEEEARDLVFQTLKTLFNVDGMYESKEGGGSSGSNSQQDSALPPPKKRARIAESTSPTPISDAASFDAAKTLALMVQQERSAVKKEVVTAPQPSMLSDAHSAAVQNGLVSEAQNKLPFFSMHQQQGTVPLIAFGRPTPVIEGIPMPALKETDILVGASGQGVLELPHIGNQRFHSLVGSKLSLFFQGDKMNKLRVAQLCVTLIHESFPRGRFLIPNPSDGLCYEVSKEKAWSKTLRTFKAHMVKFVAQRPQQQQPAVYQRIAKELDAINKRKAVLEQLLRQQRNSASSSQATARNYGTPSLELNQLAARQG